MSSTGSDLADWYIIDEKQSSNDIGMGDPEKTQKQGNDSSVGCQNEDSKTVEVISCQEQDRNEGLPKGEDKGIQVLKECLKPCLNDSSVTAEDGVQMLQETVETDRSCNEMDSCSVGSNSSSVPEGTAATASSFDDRFHDEEKEITDEKMEQMRREILKPLFSPVSVYNYCMSLFILGILFLFVLVTGITFLAKQVFATVYDICKRFPWSKLRTIDLAKMRFWLIVLFSCIICFLPYTFSVPLLVDTVILCNVMFGEVIICGICRTFKSWRELGRQVFQNFLNEIKMEIPGTTPISSVEMDSGLPVSDDHANASPTEPERDAVPATRPTISGVTLRSAVGLFEQVGKMLQPLLCVFYFFLTVFCLCSLIVLAFAYAVTAVLTYMCCKILPALFDTCYKFVSRHAENGFIWIVQYSSVVLPSADGEEN